MCFTIKSKNNYNFNGAIIPPVSSSIQDILASLVSFNSFQGHPVIRRFTTMKYTGVKIIRACAFNKKLWGSYSDSQHVSILSCYWLTGFKADDLPLSKQYTVQ